MTLSQNQSKYERTAFGALGWEQEPVLSLSFAWVIWVGTCSGSPESSTFSVHFVLNWRGVSGPDRPAAVPQQGEQPLSVQWGRGVGHSIWTELRWLSLPEQDHRISSLVSPPD